MKKRIGVLLSGGVDSAALIYHYQALGFLVWPIYISCGLPWEKQELFWIKKLLRSLKITSIEELQIARLSLENAYRKNWSLTGRTPGPRSQDASVFLPARNYLLITKAILFLFSRRIYTVSIGVLKGNPFKDASPSYIHALENLLSQSFSKPIRIETPFRQTTKANLIKKFSHAPLHLSFSCVNPHSTIHCGKCNKCIERKLAFAAANVTDLTSYALG